MQPLETQSWTDRMITIAIVIALAVIVWLLVRLVIRRVIAYSVAHEKKRTDRDESKLLARAGLNPSKRQVQRTRTLGSLLNSISSFVILLVTVLTVMSILGVPMGPLLASAGIGGVAVGIGAQSLIKDFLSGLFMIFEDQYGVGDMIEVGDVYGTVDEVTLRVTRIQDKHGKVWYIRNGEVTKLANVSQGYSRAEIEVPVNYTEDPQKVTDIINDVGHKMARTKPWSRMILDEPLVQGVQSIGTESEVMVMRVIIKCMPDDDNKVRREFLAEVKAALDAAGVQGPTA